MYAVDFKKNNDLNFLECIFFQFFIKRIQFILYYLNRTFSILLKLNDYINYIFLHTIKCYVQFIYSIINIKMRDLLSDLALEIYEYIVEFINEIFKCIMYF